METVEGKYWCSMHGGWHDDKQMAERHGRCRSCNNHYMAWRYRQVRDGLPCGIEDYRTQHNIVKVPRPRTHTSTACSVCYKRSRDRGVFCRGCNNAYNNWCQRRRKFAKQNNRTITCTIEEFQLAVDQGQVVPRHKGELHTGRVVKVI